MDWLQALSNTQRAYRKAAERFLLWAITHKGKALSSMSNEDCIEYRDFLADPQPRSRWCAEVAGSIFSCASMNCHCARLKLRPAFTFGPEVRVTPTADHGLPIR